jgi:hypothetical protein
MITLSAFRWVPPLAQRPAFQKAMADHLKPFAASR